MQSKMKTAVTAFIAVAAVLFVLGSMLFGRGEQLPPLPKGPPATVLPADKVTGADVDAVKFSLVFRGYKASEVDWVLDRLARQIDDLRAELDEVRVARDNVDANAE